MPDTPLTQRARFHLDAPRDRVFPLFTAEGERAWAKGWNPEILSAGEGRASAFRTRNSQGVETLWVVVDYRPAEGRVSYARAALGSNIGIVDVTCTDGAGGGTDVSVRYTLSPLSPDGARFIHEFLEPAAYDAMIEEWRTATSAVAR